MSTQNNALSERFNGEEDGKVRESGEPDYGNLSDIIFDDTRAISKSSYKLFFTFLGSIFIMNVLAKYLMTYCNVTPLEITYCQGAISVILSMIYLNKNDIYLFSVETSKSNMVLAGSLAGFIGIAGFYLSLYHLTIMDALAIEYLTAVGTLMLDYIFFKGNFRFYQMIGLICCLLGLGFIAQPGYLLSGSEEPAKFLFGIGILAAIVGVFFASIYGAMLRRLYNKVNLFVLFTFMQIAMALFSPCFVLIHFEIRDKPTVYTFGSLLGLLITGVLGWVVHWSLASILHKEKIVSRVYPFKYLLVLGAVLVDLIGFYTRVSLSSITGVLLLGINFVVGAYYVLCL